VPTRIAKPVSPNAQEDQADCQAQIISEDIEQAETL
jgi:hypothetical protein